MCRSYDNETMEPYDMKKTKTELVTAIQRYDILNSELHLITKKNSSTNKKAALQRFLKRASEYVDDERDVVLIAIKVK